ncbi:MAG: PIN domain-containing protein [Verrucomicrobia bacterium]|nr:PIN domain-containing protein [Verrucomicrobiota bacterium]
MIYLDASVLVAAVVDIEPFHAPCARLLLSSESKIVRSHGLAETFSTLTGGRLPLRLSPAVANRLIEVNLLPRLRIVDLAASDVIRAIADSESRGVRGGAIHDLFHLFAARKAKASTLYTLNLSHFQAFHRRGDPEVRLPEPDPSPP